ncbi:MAG: topoisomerase DNA-binding C4 zinc finger domain-containing protein [Oscillospiraceae bacterium]|nr:topoisomerase DNA-binding C4 zinc finger domain-containing protein [Oscillospiraceae bacterium]
MTELEEKIFHTVREKEGLKGRQIADRLGLSSSNVNSTLRYSDALKKLVYQKEDYCWYLIDKKNAIKKTETSTVAKQSSPGMKPASAQTTEKTAKDANKNEKSEWKTDYAKGKIREPRYVRGEVCLKCGKPLVERVGKYGLFYGCSAFPECSFIKNPSGPIPGSCPKCGKKLVEGMTKKGYVYYRCESGRECGFITWHIPTEEKCEKCGKTLFWPKATNVRICLNEKCSEYEPEESSVPASKAHTSQPAKETAPQPVVKPVPKPAEEPAHKPVKKKWNNI